MTTEHNDTTDATDGLDDKPDWWGNLEDGTREDATINNEIERHYLRHDGKRFWVDLKQPSWQKKSSVVDDALKIERNGQELDTTQYYRDMLEYMLEGASFDVENINQFLAGARPELAEKIMDPVPAPGRSTSEEEEGNSEQPSEEDLKEGASDRTTPPGHGTNAG